MSGDCLDRLILTWLHCHDLDPRTDRALSKAIATTQCEGLAFGLALSQAQRQGLVESARQQ